MKPTIVLPSVPELPELTAESLARSRLYRMLSLALAPPPTMVLHRAVSSEIIEDLNRLGSLIAPELALAAESFARALKGAEAQPELILSDYGANFEESGTGRFPLYETEYTSAEIFAKMNAMADVAGFYRAFGMKNSPAMRERPDHASVELEFMHLLTFMEANALAVGDDEKAQICEQAERKFMQDHLGCWLPSLGRRISQSSTTSLYRSVGGFLASFLENEIARMGVNPNRVAAKVKRPPDTGQVANCGFGAPGSL